MGLISGCKELSKYGPSDADADADADAAGAGVGTSPRSGSKKG
jgi:hypothetical protein